MALFLNLQKDNSSTPIERTIIDYIINYPNDVVEMSMEEFARKTYSSRSSIARFCKKHGFKGFAELKIQLALELNLYLSNLDLRDNALPFDKNDDNKTVIEKMTVANMYSLQETMRANPPSMFVAAANIMSSANSVVFMGVQHSGVISNDAHIRFSRIGINSKYFVTENEIMTYSFYADPRDVVVFLCYSGATAIILDAAKYCKQRNAIIIGITRNEKSELMDYCDMCFYVNSLDHPKNNLSLSSEIATISIIDAIFCVLLNSQKEEGYKRIVQVADIYERLYKKEK
ncbi:MAG: MurR/RpiR family transcriptional regulator [Erysipelotrichaceae bacterium]|nr:MurR/RpiR family transcriptional regulator [Erysipelotrichaceae bacterium]